MKQILSLAAAALASLLAGCGTLDISSEGNPDRVLTGSVRPPVTLPAGAEILVQVVDPAPPSPTMTPANELPVANRTRLPAVPRILGEYRQTLSAAVIDPVPFRLEYHATDDELRRGVNVDVRVSVAGHVRFRTINAYVVTLSSSPFPQEVPVQPLE